MKIEDISPEKRDDRLEVQNYIHALNYGIKRIIEDNFPFSTRFIRELHSKLMIGVRDEKKTPGEFRKSQNWIGGSSPSNAIFVPPSHEHLAELLSDLEFFINNDEIDIPYLIKLAIIHYQFETIHPFLDGNGRIGRLLIPLLMLEYNILTKPCFYISNYFDKNRAMYYDTLTRVRENNDITGWIKFFLEAVIYTSENAKNKFNRVITLVEKYRNLQFEIKGKPENVSKVLNCFYDNPILSLSDIEKEIDLSRGTISSIVRELEKKSILKEITGYNRNKLYLLIEYFNIFAE